jgi:hypothetical protein
MDSYIREYLDVAQGSEAADDSGVTENLDTAEDSDVTGNYDIAKDSDITDITITFSRGFRCPIRSVHV